MVTQYHKATGRIEIPTRTFEVLEVEPDVEFPDRTWGMESLELPIGVPVADLRSKRRLGYWNGAGLSLDPPKIDFPVGRTK